MESATNEHTHTHSHTYIHTHFPKQKESGTDQFTGEFYKILIEEIIQILYKIFQRTEAEEILPTSFHKATNIPISDQDIARKLKINIPYKHIYKTLEKNCKSYPTMYKINYTPQARGITLGM